MITLSCFIFQKETTPLLCAVAKGHQDVCLRLIKHGANINSQNHVSIQDVCLRLIKHGANINSQNHVSIHRLCFIYMSVYTVLIHEHKTET